ncbi:MAG: DUF58 domain-containing protein [Pseudomonadota bacterium]
MSLDPIPPDVRSRLKGLQLESRRALGAHGIGNHMSRSRGAGLEFAQYRAYEPGDEPRQIDWKLYARSDKFFVREAERESPVALWILIDASASMGQEDAARPGWSRLDAARTIAACLAELAIRQGDRFGAATLSDDGVWVVAPGGGVRQRDRMRIELGQVGARGGFPDDAGLGQLLDRIGARDLVMMLSDGFDPGVLELTRKLAAAGREVLSIELLSVAERDFAFDGGYRFRDPETGEELLGDGTALRADFLARFGAARAAYHAALDAAGVRRADYVLDQPVDAPLQTLFGRKA